MKITLHLIIFYTFLLLLNAMEMQKIMKADHITFKTDKTKETLVDIQIDLMQFSDANDSFTFFFKSKNNESWLKSTSLVRDKLINESWKRQIKYKYFTGPVDCAYSSINFKFINEQNIKEEAELYFNEELRKEEVQYEVLL